MSSSERPLGNMSLALLLIAVAGTAMLSGLELCLFEIDAQRTQEAGSTTPPGERTTWLQEETSPKIDVAALMSPWRDKALVGGVARTIIAMDGNSAASDAHHLLNTAGVLSVRPTDGAQWLAYADYTMRMGYGDGSALKAIDMSMIVERREVATMFSATLLSLQIWEHYSSRRKQEILARVGDLWGFMGRTQREIVVAALAAQPPKSRAEIYGALVPNLKSDPRILRALSPDSS